MNDRAARVEIKTGAGNGAAQTQRLGNGGQGISSWLGSLAIGLAGAVSGITGTWASRAGGKK